MPEDLAIPSKTEEHISALNSALSKLEPYRGVVFRGSNISGDNLAEYELDKIVTAPGFASSTKSYTKSEKFSRGVKSEFMDDVNFLITSHFGRDVSKFARDSTEDEVLFASGTRFKVRSRREYGNYPLIELDDLGPGDNVDAPLPDGPPIHTDTVRSSPAR
ncbi:ADP-ribosyltransferase domain-containing protein [Mycobacterium montefiorense]|uniref:NAD(+)--protein-arginine ADP-ribosyltransferase n=1 Tax=Mycobacterium montefiorense TaxID=154654 RepID=A0AA37UV05_9MYCO|nr:hypothetical protein NJB14191_53140 [Mycobacterium montefiorense]GKU39246.1 hypothetical protein NJB14192_12410 [Mycobacterium montefiorense]GKU44765.1 hypothetical protein NJB14194_13910 [Mycobacterium montefiorense]GKU53828.1 hypothetical protein NJB14195_50690 [Mycobacterium montefiorense]GKU59286.1 hypothetical protein NJB14197_51460 [Mycobacterium montefiorense]